LQPTTWALLLGGATLAFGTPALLKRRRRAAAMHASPSRIKLADGLLLGLGGVFVVGALVVAQRGAVEQPAQGFTQLWMVPAVVDEEQPAVQVGISNLESGATSYDLQLVAADNVVGEWGSVRLEPGQRWVGLAVLPDALSGPLEARLYRSDSPQTLYRHVVLRRTGATHAGLAEARP
ncbi:MAG: hypothetical protein M3336_07940, partial [Chloroflexota bacterium]|nr:hypothetical protein [Chloroflexota bacterium]